MNPEREHADRVLQGLIARLEMDADLGLEHVALRGGFADAVEALRALAAPRTQSSSTSAASSPVPPPAPVRRAAPAVAPAAAPARATPASAPVAPAAAPKPPSGRFRTSLVPIPDVVANPAKEAALAALRDACMVCRECKLCEKRSSVVWGEGSLDASVMFIGEGPGRDEDIEARPFVGRSGRVLTDIIEKGMKTPRGSVYIANVVKCRPPGNRDPQPDEAEACSRYLREQIKVIGPKAIVAVGGVAGCALLGLPPRSPGLRGKWHEYAGIPMRVIYHPSYLLRQRGAANERTAADRETWMDIQEVMAKVF